MLHIHHIDQQQQRQPQAAVALNPSCLLTGTKPHSMPQSRITADQTQQQLPSLHNNTADGGGAARADPDKDQVDLTENRVAPLAYMCAATL